MWVELEQDLAELFGDVRIEVRDFKTNHLRVHSRGDRSGQCKRYRAKMTPAQREAERVRHRAYYARKKAEKKPGRSPRGS